MLEAATHDECLLTNRVRPTDDGTTAELELLPLDAAGTEKCGTEPVANIRCNEKCLGSSVKDSDVLSRVLALWWTLDHMGTVSADVC